MVFRLERCRDCGCKSRRPGRQGHSRPRPKRTPGLHGTVWFWPGRSFVGGSGKTSRVKNETLNAARRQEKQCEQYKIPFHMSRRSKSVLLPRTSHLREEGKGKAAMTLHGNRQYLKHTRHRSWKPCQAANQPYKDNELEIPSYILAGTHLPTEALHC